MSKHLFGIIFGSLFLLTVSEAQPLAQAADKQAAEKKEQQKKVREAFIRKMGGFVVPPAIGPGILIADLQSGIATGAVKQVSLDLAKTVLLPFRYAMLQPSSTLWASAEMALAQNEAVFAVLVVDQPELPALVAAPEARWAAVNVAPLRQGVNQEVYIRRVKQEVWRATCLALGASDSQVKKCVMGQVFIASDLDSLGEAANPEYLNKMLRRAEAKGIKPQHPVSYRKAVEEGWANPPANEIQKAIWDEVKASKK